MAIRPRVRPSFIDLSDLRQMIEEIVQENEELYDLTYKTLIEAFTEPLSRAEVDAILGRLSALEFAELQRNDPEAAVLLWRELRERIERS